MHSGGAPRAPRCIAAHLRSKVRSSPGPVSLIDAHLTPPRDRIILHTVLMLKRR